MNNTEHGSEVARLLQQIDQECEAARHGLSGLALGTARHDFITTRLERIVACQEQLATRVGEEEAARLLVAHYVQAIGAIEVSIMSTLSEVSHRENTYVIDIESGAETARLMHQHRLVTAGMGGVFPETLHISQVQHILDIACGPGDWALDVAFEYPEAEVMGIDLSRTMVEYARARAGVQGLDNARFCVMDALQPLAFPDDAFDLVNARFLCGYMSTTAWPALLNECVRVTRPGGLICLTEAENGISTSPACEQISALCARAMQVAGHSFSPDGRHLGVTALLGRFLREAGCQHIQQQAHVIDYSVDTDVHRSMFTNCNVSVEVLKPFLMRMGVITGDELECLHREATIEMLSDDFCGVWFLLSAWGTKHHQFHPPVR